MLVENTSSNIQNNPAFDIVRSTKVSMMRDAKARFGKGNKEHLSCGLRVAEINYILGSNVLSLYTLFGLHSSTFSSAFTISAGWVGKEAHNLMSGEIHPIYYPNGTPRIIAYIPFHALKKN